MTSSAGELRPCELRVSWNKRAYPWPYVRSRNSLRPISMCDLLHILRLCDVTQMRKKEGEMSSFNALMTPVIQKNNLPRCISVF
jgi:hypothetical protein